MERIALVTGGSSGIGRAAVQALAEAGWYVCFTCRDIVRGETAAEAVRAVGGSCEAFRADLADTAASRALVAQLTERFGRLDVLVNCAGISNTKSIEEIDEAEWDTMLNVNLRGIFPDAGGVSGHEAAAERQNHHAHLDRRAARRSPCPRA